MTVDRTLRRSPLVYLAVETGSGIHVTPRAYGSWDRGIWFVSGRSTAVASAADTSSPVGALLYEDGRWHPSTGRIRSIDPLAPVSALRTLAHHGPVDVCRGVIALGLTLAGMLTSQIADPLAAVRRLGLLNGALFRYSPERTAVVEGTQVVNRSGSWSPVPASLSRIPDEVADLGQGEPSQAVLGWSSRSGPVCLPCVWDPSRQVVEVAREVFRIAGASMSGPAAITLVDSSDDSISGQRGLMLRGEGVATADGDVVRIAIDLERASFWSDADTGSAALSSGSPVPRRVRFEG